MYRSLVIFIAGRRSYAPTFGALVLPAHPVQEEALIGRRFPLKLFCCAIDDRGLIKRHKRHFLGYESADGLVVLKTGLFVQRAACGFQRLVDFRIVRG